MKSKSIQKIIKNLKAKGFEPESITETKHDTQVYYESSFIMLQKNTSKPIIGVSLPISYEMTFDQSNIDYLNNKGIKYWSIHKHWLEFSYQAKDEKDLEETIEELLETYNYN